MIKLNDAESNKDQSVHKKIEERGYFMPHGYVTRNENSLRVLWRRYYVSYWLQMAVNENLLCPILEEKEGDRKQERVKFMWLFSLMILSCSWDDSIDDVKGKGGNIPVVFSSIPLFFSLSRMRESIENLRQLEVCIFMEWGSWMMCYKKNIDVWRTFEY